MRKRTARLRWGAILVGVALTASACSSDTDDDSSSREVAQQTEQPKKERHEAGDPIAALLPLKKGQGLHAQSAFSVGPVAANNRYVFWAAAAGDEDEDVVLLRRDLRSGTVRTLTRGVFRAFGLATTPSALMYATRSGAGVALVAINPAGERRRLLSRSLIAPFDARGDMVAWAEGNALRHRVIVRNMRTERQWVAMNAARCQGTRCYRIDRVTVADEGVVFGLGSVGQGYPSLIGRLRWTDAKPSFARIANDPQPDLVSSSIGALYYQLRRGWVEWEFDENRPRLTSLRNARPWLLAANGNRRLVLKGPTCGAKVAVRLVGGRTEALPVPKSTPASPTKFGPLCRQLMGFAWTGDRVFFAWTLTPKISLEAHEDVGMTGIITAARVP